MDIRPIKNINEYEKVLNEIEKLADAGPDSEEGELREVLMALAEYFENHNFATGNTQWLDTFRVPD